MKRLLLILSFALLASATNASERNAAPSELLASFGRAQFVEHCASCHGMKGRGDGPAATSLKIAPADLTRIATRRDGVFPDGDIAAIIDGRTEVAAHGSRAMPVWGRDFSARLGEDDIGDQLTRGRVLILVEYLKTIQR